tara:strand:+ start:233 stop:496 length:264 start_codon:yes stop_codon:yes gene_type:complete
MGVSVRVDGVMVVAALIVGAGVYAYSQKEKIAAAANKVNPASNQNFVYQAVEGDTLTAIADKYFAYVELINPFNESDEYAKSVWGLK